MCHQKSTAKLCSAMTRAASSKEYFCITVSMHTESWNISETLFHTDPPKCLWIISSASWALINGSLAQSGAQRLHDFPCLPLALLRVPGIFCHGNRRTIVNRQ